MPRRTLGDARATLDGLPLTLQQRRQLEQELVTRRREAARRITDQLQVSHNNMTEGMGGLRRELRFVDKELAQLEEEGRSGPLSAAEYGKRYQALMDRHTAATRNLDAIATSIEAYSAKALDPFAAADDFFARHPAVRPNFSW
jgi:chromosome segregation ATPase